MLARFAAVLAAFLIGANPVLASSANAVTNKEGYWKVDADGDSCAASMMLQGGSVFLLRGHEGDVAVALFAGAVLPKGKTLSLEADGETIDLPATFPKEHTLVYLDGALDAPSLAKLRGARQLRVLIDGQAVAAMTLEGTGFPGALDSLVACSRGQSGWWGKGAQHDGSPPPAQPKTYVYNAEDVWVLAPLEDAGMCFAQAATDEKDRYLQFVQQGADVTIAVRSSGRGLPRGRKGELVMDGGTFVVTPSYDGKTLMVLDGSLTDEALNVLKATKGLTLRIDGKVLIDGNLDGTGFPKILDELAACARGETGWWTPNAP
ncbi:MAG: hypothetical protein JWM33_1626 [Caulobacteraceae bacterium]|nr:hypothetical protein [Caulobacteraceae bacterium]